MDIEEVFTAPENQEALREVREQFFSGTLPENWENSFIKAAGPDRHPVNQMGCTMIAFAGYPNQKLSCNDSATASATISRNSTGSLADASTATPASISPEQALACVPTAAFGIKHLPRLCEILRYIYEHDNDGPRLIEEMFTTPFYAPQDLDKRGFPKIRRPFN